LPLTPFQEEVLRLLAEHRSPDSYLAGGAALHGAPNSLRFSQDLDFFHDSEERTAEAFSADRALLEGAGFSVEVAYALPGNVRALVSRGDGRTLIDWAHDTAWRFMPAIRDPGSWYRLHEVDLAINKLLAVTGRDEARDLLDLLEAHDRILPLGALVWAASGKDPGLSPHAILELLKRRGRFRQEDMDRLHLARRVDAGSLRDEWRRALTEADAFVSARPADELGCLYYHESTRTFTAPRPDRSLEDQGLSPHFGGPGGVLPLARATPPEG
jgi:hypothetical protein